MKTSYRKTTVDIQVRYCSVCDPISAIDVGQSMEFIERLREKRVFDLFDPA